MQRSCTTRLCAAQRPAHMACIAVVQDVEAAVRVLRRCLNVRRAAQSIAADKSPKISRTNPALFQFIRCRQCLCCVSLVWYPERVWPFVQWHHAQQRALSPCCCCSDACIWAVGCSSPARSGFSFQLPRAQPRSAAAQPAHAQTPTHPTHVIPSWWCSAQSPRLLSAVSLLGQHPHPQHLHRRHRHQPRSPSPSWQGTPLWTSICQLGRAAL
jgi:hypothetical protein